MPKEKPSAEIRRVTLYKSSDPYQMLSSFELIRYPESPLPLFEIVKIIGDKRRRVIPGNASDIVVD